MNTPKPWKLEPAHRQLRAAIVGPSGLVVAEVSDEEDAVEILRACNNFDELLAAVVNLIDNVELLFGYSSIRLKTSQFWQTFLDAKAKAEAKP